MAKCFLFLELCLRSPNQHQTLHLELVGSIVEITEGLLEEQNHQALAMLRYATQERKLRGQCLALKRNFLEGIENELGKCEVTSVTNSKDNNMGRTCYKIFIAVAPDVMQISHFFSMCLYL